MSRKGSESQNMQKDYVLCYEFGICKTDVFCHLHQRVYATNIVSVTSHSDATFLSQQRFDETFKFFVLTVNEEIKVVRNKQKYFCTVDRLTIFYR